MYVELFTMENGVLGKCLSNDEVHLWAEYCKEQYESTVLKRLDLADLQILPLKDYPCSELDPKIKKVFKFLRETCHGDIAIWESRDQEVATSILLYREEEPEYKHFMVAQWSATPLCTINEIKEILQYKWYKNTEKEEHSARWSAGVVTALCFMLTVGLFFFADWPLSAAIYLKIFLGAVIVGLWFLKILYNHTAPENSDLIQAIWRHDAQMTGE